MNPPSLPLNDITELEHLRRCPICGSERLRLWRQGFDRLHRISTQIFTYSQCLGCSVIFLSQRPSESQIQSFYPDDYGPYRGGETSSKSPNASPFPFAKRLRGASTRAVGRSALFLKSGLNSIFPDKLPGVLQQFYTPSQRGLKMLDFGCGSDRFLNSAAEKGWDTIGLDFSPRAVEQVRQSGHKAILMSPTAWSDLEDSSLDFVRMNHVLEHLYDPTEVLRNIKLKMKEGAVLHIALPNPLSLSSKIFRSRWFSLDCPRHIFLYSPASLIRLLSATGFDRSQVFQEMITKDMARSLGYLMHEKGWINHVEIEEIMHIPDLTNLLSVPAKVASVFGVADRFHVFSQK